MAIMAGTKTPRKVSALHKVFVYGTLRPRDEVGHVLPATHRLNWYQMFSAGAFPYIAESAGDDDTAVVGNVIEVRAVELPELDRYENVHGGLYVRQRVMAEPLDGGKDVEVWVYVAGPALTPPPITSGDWFNR